MEWNFSAAHLFARAGRKSDLISSSALYLLFCACTIRLWSRQIDCHTPRMCKGHQTLAESLVHLSMQHRGTITLGDVQNFPIALHRSIMPIKEVLERPPLYLVTKSCDPTLGTCHQPLGLCGSFVAWDTLLEEAIVKHWELVLQIYWKLAYSVV